MRLCIAISVALALAPAAATAEEKQYQPGAQQKADDKIICKRHETFMTGTRLSRPKKVCMTARDWQEVKGETDKTMQRLKEGKVSPDQPGTLGGGPN